MKTVQTIYGVFDTDLGRLVGIAPQGVPDVTFIAGQDTQTDGLPVTVKSNPVTGGSEISAGGKKIIEGDAVDSGSGLRRFTSTVTPTIAAGVINTYRTAVIAAADTVTVAELDALRYPLSRLIRSTVWAKLKVLWVPLGTDATKGALIPLKGAAFSAVGLVAGDYSSFAGITGNGTSKAINTNFNPNSVASSWGAAGFVTSLTASGVVFGTLTGVNTFCALSSSAGNLNNINVGAQKQLAGLNGLQTDGTTGQALIGGYVQTSAAMTGAVAPNSALTLLATNSANWSSQSIIGFAAWSPVLTTAEIKELDAFFRSVNLSLGRLAYQPSACYPGDSITAGYGLSSPSTERFSKLISDALAITEDNQGVNGSTMSNDDDGSSSMRWVSARPIANSAGRNPSLMVVGLGTNDDRCQVPLANYEADYRSWLDNQFNSGLDPSALILISPFAAQDVLASDSRLSAMNTIVQTIAAEKGAIYVDGYNLTKGRLDYFQADKVHLNATGHISVKDEVLRVLSLTKSESPLYRPAYQI